MTTSTLADPAPTLPLARPIGADAPVLLGLAALWTVAWLLLDPSGNFPLGDDWSYAYAVRSILDTGRFQLLSFSAPNMIAQAYWGALFCLPFGFSYEALRLSTFVLSVVCVLASFLLLREAGADRPTAAVGALTLGANPLFMQLSVGFMTDVPFLALVTASLLFYARGARAGHAASVVAAYALALLALLTRQFALALPLAFAAELLVRRGLSVRSLAQAVLPILLFAAIHIAFQHWMVATGRIPHFNNELDLSHISLAGRMSYLRPTALAMLPYAGLFALPFVIFLVATGRLRNHPLLIASTVLGLLLFAVLLWRHATLPGFGISLERQGLGSLTLYDVWTGRNVPTAWGAGPFWLALTGLGAWATATLAVVIVRLAATLATRRGRAGAAPFPWMLLTFCAAYFAALVLAMLVGMVFDRYLVITIVPFCAMLLTAAGPARRPARPVLAALPLLACAILSVAAAHDYVAFNRTRWKAVALLDRAGVPPDVIDGGFEYGGARLFDPDYTVTPGKGAWWIRDNRYVLALGPLPGYRTVDVLGFKHWLVFTQYSIHILRRL